MADVWRIARVVECIGKITTKNYVFPEVSLLSYSKGPTQDTHIRMNAHQNDILSPFLLDEIEDFLTIIADAVITYNFNLLVKLI